ncbi:MAG: low molecular weight protein-tyrosine-phosphatase [Pseudomonadota bacterium]
MQWEKDKGLSVLFVCLGNICRSPMAEGAFRSAALKAGLDVKVASVGTAGYHIGDPPDPRAIEVARRHGVDIAGNRGRQLAESDFSAFTHIFALDTANLAGINARSPRHHGAHISLLLDVFDGSRGESVADPYYGDADDFADCWDQITRASAELAKQLTRETGTFAA